MAGGRSTKEVKQSEALAYVKAVKREFKHDMQVYYDFKQVLHDFRAERIETEDVIERVKYLFRGHPDLILGFSVYLPSGYESALLLTA